MDIGDLGELIPIILLAAYYLFRPSKKDQQKQQPKRQRPQPSSTKSLEDIMRELMGEESKAETIVEEPTKEEEVTQKMEDDYSEFMEENPYANYTGQVSDAKKKSIISDRVTLNEEHGIEKREIEVDLRQAVIYDAILHRPYD